MHAAIDSNLTVVGHTLQRMFSVNLLHIFSGQNNWRKKNWQKKHWRMKFYPPNPPMFFTAKVLCYMVSLASPLKMYSKYVLLNWNLC